MCEEDSATVKCMLIGESGVGKTSLVVSYTKDDYPAHHEPTALDKYVVDLRIENHHVNLQICDAGGADSVRSLRAISYPDVHVIILCFSVVQPETLWALRNRWLPEFANGVPLNPSALETAVRTGCATPRVTPPAAFDPATPRPAFLLVGCACDLRNDIQRLLDLSSRGEQPVDESVAQKVAHEFGAEAYIECSALTQKHLKKVFDLAVWHGLRVKEEARLRLAQATSQQHELHRRSLSNSSSRKQPKMQQQRQVRHRSVDANANNNNRAPLTSSQRSLWKKLMCLRW